MKEIILLITAFTMLLTLACGKTAESNILPNESGGVPQIGSSFDAGSSTADNSSNNANAPTTGTETNGGDNKETDAMINISITIGGSAFSAKLYDSETAKALVEQFPITLNMSELNGNEKFYYLPDNLPTDSKRVGSINAGDLMLYGSDCLVLFYKSFSTSYSYTRLGYIEDASNLAAALGNGSVNVSFDISK